MQQPVQCSVDWWAGTSAGEFGQDLLGLSGHGDAGVAGEDQVAQPITGREELLGQQVGAQRRDRGRVAARVELA